MELTALQPRGVSRFSHTCYAANTQKDPELIPGVFFLRLCVPSGTLPNSHHCLGLLELRPLGPGWLSGCMLLGSPPELWLEGAADREPEQS